MKDEIANVLSDYPDVLRFLLQTTKPVANKVNIKAHPGSGIDVTEMFQLTDCCKAEISAKRHQSSESPEKEWSRIES